MSKDEDLTEGFVCEEKKEEKVTKLTLLTDFINDIKKERANKHPDRNGFIEVKIKFRLMDEEIEMIKNCKVSYDAYVQEKVNELVSARYALRYRAEETNEILNLLNQKIVDCFNKLNEKGEPENGKTQSTN